jgi:hypothetical protein
MQLAMQAREGGYETKGDNDTRDYESEDDGVESLLLQKLSSCHGLWAADHFHVGAVVSLRRWWGGVGVVDGC